MASKKKTTKKVAKKKAAKKKATKRTSEPIKVNKTCQAACKKYTEAERNAKAADTRLAKAWEEIANARAEKAKTRNALTNAKAGVKKFGVMAEACLGRKLRILKG